MRVSGHIPHDMDATECVKLGYDEIQHFSFIMVNFQPDAKTVSASGMKRILADYAATETLDLDSKEVQDFTELLQGTSCRSRSNTEPNGGNDVAVAFGPSTDVPGIRRPLASSESASNFSGYCVEACRRTGIG